MNIGSIGPAAALGLAAIGSALGTGAAGQASMGAWKKCFAANRPAPFMLAVFSGAPITQTLYGFLLMLFIRDSQKDPLTLLSAGIFGGLAIGFSAMMQGRAAAGAADALADTGKGTANYIAVIGIIETVAIFVMIFLLLVLAEF